jgi:hypothetical protein
LRKAHIRVLSAAEYIFVWRANATLLFGVTYISTYTRFIEKIYSCAATRRGRAMRKRLRLAAGEGEEAVLERGAFGDGYFGTDGAHFAHFFGLRFKHLI